MIETTDEQIRSDSMDEGAKSGGRRHKVPSDITDAERGPMYWEACGSMKSIREKESKNINGGKIMVRPRNLNLKQ